MKDYYRILGVSLQASDREIRRAYRILARRYHPDLNPNNAEAQSRFREIAEAYDTLSNPEKRQAFDAEFEGDLAYHRLRAASEAARVRQTSKPGGSRGDKTKAARRETPFGSEGFAYPSSDESIPLPEIKGFVQTVKQAGVKLVETLQHVKKNGFKSFNKKETTKGEREPGTSVKKLSILEISVSLKEALLGAKKAIEIEEQNHDAGRSRKVSVSIPAGIRSGAIIRLRNRADTAEEIVFVVRVNSHPFISIQPRGVVVDIPVTLAEAIAGASITVPTFEDSTSVRIPAGCQSGSEIRLKERGILQRDGTRGDIFYRLFVKIPEAQGAVGLLEKSQEIERYYGTPVRSLLPTTLADA